MKRACATCGRGFTPTPEHPRHCPRHWPSVTSWAGGSTRAWRKLRDAVLERDDHTCKYCGAHATHADHLHPRSMGGADTEANLVAACADCNLLRGSDGAAGGEVRAHRRR